MGNLGILELLIILTAAVAVIAVVVISVTKLIKCKIEPNKKIVWIIVMLLFEVLGVIAFLVYHDYFLTPELRANF